MSEITSLSEKDYANQIAYQRKHIAAQENSRKQKPTQRDIQRVIRFLKQFCIRIKPNQIPKLETKGDLERWKKKIIKNGGIKQEEN